MKLTLHLVIINCVCILNGCTPIHQIKFECEKVIDHNILPRIQVGDYLKTTPSDRYKYKKYRDVRDKLSDDLYIHYAGMSHYGIGNISYLSLSKRNLNEENYKKIANTNLKKYFSCTGVTLEKVGGSYYVSPHMGSFDASIMLIKEYWDNIETKGSPLVFLDKGTGNIKVVDSHDQNAVIKASVATLYFGLNPDGTNKVYGKLPLTGYIYKSGKWIKYNTPNKTLQQTPKSGAAEF